VQVKYKEDMKNWRFLTNISLYFVTGRPTTRHGHSYNGRRIGTRMRSIEWRHFQRPWVTPGWRFQGHDILNVKYLENGTRYIFCNGRLIESRIWLIEWRHFQW